MTEERNLSNLKWKLKQSLRNKVSGKLMLHERYKSRLKSVVRMQISGQQTKLVMLEKSIEAHSPAFLLKHGYTITTLNGKRISSVKDIKKGDKIRTFVHDGDMVSEVIE